MQSTDSLNRIFIYGTLIPGQQRWKYLAEFVAATEPDTTAGLLYDTHLDYPAARFDATNSIQQLIHGQLITIHRERLDDCLVLLDEVESVVTGLYHRVVIETGSGHHAWSYQYGKGIDDLELIESGSWLDHVNQ